MLHMHVSERKATLYTCSIQDSNLVNKYDKEKSATLLLPQVKKRFSVIVKNDQDGSSVE